jgi:hypothetical protein
MEDMPPQFWVWRFMNSTLEFLSLAFEAVHYLAASLSEHWTSPYFPKQILKLT